MISDLSSSQSISKLKYMYFPRMLHVVKSLLVLLVISARPGLSEKMVMISTEVGASLPPRAGQAEILNSSLVKFNQVTVCAR